MSALNAQHRYEMLQAGLDLVDQGVTVFDADLCMVAWNETFLRLLDFPREMAYVGAPLESFIRYNAERGEYGPGEVETQVRERIELARCFQPHVRERARPNGTLLLLRGEPIPHRGFVTLYTDITEQRFIDNLIQHQNIQLEERVKRRTAQLENANANLLRANAEKSRIAEALRRSEARLRLINDTIPTLIAYVDKHQVYQYANRGYAEWFGIPEGQVMGRTIPDLISYHVFDQIQDRVEAALAGHMVTYEYSMERQGKTVHARSTLVPEIGAAGDCLGFFVFSYDITEEKRMQAALVQAQKMEVVGQLTGGLAHDFNNLLTVVIGNLAALQDRCGGTGEVNEFVEPALQSARRGVQLIKRLLTFSRQQSLELQSTNVGSLVKGTVSLVRRSLPESITISSEVPDGPLFALVDPGQLESALLNFALNARDAMPDGGRLHIGVQHVDLAAGNEFEVAPGTYLLIEVADNGTGMDEATLARVFEPFFTTKRLGLGSGLGLSMAHGFAKQAGGALRIRSAPGQGSTVLLALPRSHYDEVGETPGEVLPATVGGQLVLLVEDDPAVRRVVRQQLVDLGYPVLEADNGALALELIEQVPDITLVLSDVVMPGGVNGRQVASRILAGYPEVGVVLMSGYAEGWSDGEADRLPVLVKPFTKQELARALCSASPRKA